MGFTYGLCHDKPLDCTETSRFLFAMNLSLRAIHCLATLCCLILLAACTATPRNSHEAAEETTAPAATAEPVVYAERAFPDDSLHELLLAEFALRRREYGVALDTYLEQAPLLRDPGVSAHATRLAQYMESNEDTLKASQLWVELEPENLEAHSILARQLVLAGRNADALPHLAALERHGEGANFTILTNDFQQLPVAEQTALVAGLDAIAPEFPGSDSLLITLALLHSEMSDQTAALANLQALFEIKPDHTQGLLLEAKILADSGDPNAYQRLESSLAKDPENRTLRLHYARLLTATDMRAAREQFEVLSAQSPDDGDLLFSLALINREIGDPITASAYLRQMLELNQRTDEAHYYLGRIEQDRDRFEDALRYYEAVQSGDEYMAANARIGEILLQQGAVARSLAWYAAQRERHPELSERLYGLESDLLGRHGQNDHASAVLSEALLQHPEDAGLLYARAMQREQQNDLAGMERDLRGILLREPDNVTALNALGYTLGNRTQRYEEALQLVSRALELQPEEPAILDSMGWILFRMGRLDEALDYLSRAHANFPDAEVASHLGEVLWTMGDTEGALRVWRSAYAHSPDHPILRETLRRLHITLPKDVPGEQRPTE